MPRKDSEGKTKPIDIPSKKKRSKVPEDDDDSSVDSKGNVRNLIDYDYSDSDSEVDRRVPRKAAVIAKRKIQEAIAEKEAKDAAKKTGGAPAVAKADKTDKTEKADKADKRRIKPTLIIESEEESEEEEEVPVRKRSSPKKKPAKKEEETEEEEEEAKTPIVIPAKTLSTLINQCAMHHHVRLTALVQNI